MKRIRAFIIVDLVVAPGGSAANAMGKHVSPRAELRA
jgi:hypothetical protein